ncbi:MAG: peptidylprolyl isomerase [Candidatus Omnitrophica bacterium]|nr:peptidylprolyl isomerase [Candidatus Omnitrophota bacterium]
MKHFYLVLFTFLALLPPAFAESQLVERVVAVVNDEPITQSELDFLLRPVYENYSKEYQGDMLAEKLDDARQKLLNQLIEDRLVIQEAKARGIEADPAELEKEWDQLRTRLSGQKKMEDALASEGLTQTSMKDQLKKQLMIRNLQDQEIRAKVVVSPLAVEEYYKTHIEEFSGQERLKVRSITLTKSEEARERGLADEIAKAKIEDIYKRVKAGSDFEEQAKNFSEDSNAKNGGISEWVMRGEMIPAIDEIIFKLTPGQISEIIETPMGYHIFRLEEKEEGKKKSLEEVRSEIFGKLYQKEASKRFREWMQELKRNAYISVR